MSVKTESNLYQLERAIINNWLVVRRRAADQLKQNQFDLTLEQLLVLHLLDERDGRSLTELSQSAGRERTTLTRMIDNLEKHGLVAVTPDTDDKRQKLVHLTDKGRSKHASAHACCSKLCEAAAQNVDGAEVELTYRTLEKISDNLRKR